MNSNHEQQTEDVQVETALRHFRESVHHWSGQEYSRPRSVAATRRSGLWFLRNRMAGWGLASVLTIAAVGVPTGIHIRHEIQIKAEQEAAIADQAKREEAQRQASLQINSLQINDEELMSHVDQDIAQAAPDAMEPLASLMSDSTSE
jgi:hypothetical protein